MEKNETDYFATLAKVDGSIRQAVKALYRLLRYARNDDIAGMIAGWFGWRLRRQPNQPQILKNIRPCERSEATSTVTERLQKETQIISV